MPFSYFFLLQAHDCFGHWLAEGKMEKRGFEDEGLYVVIGEICPLGHREFQTREL